MTTGQILVFSVGCYLAVGYLVAFPVIAYAVQMQGHDATIAAMRTYPKTFATVLALMWPPIVVALAYGFGGALWSSLRETYLHWRLRAHLKALERITRQLTKSGADHSHKGEN